MNEDQKLTLPKDNGQKFDMLVEAVKSGKRVTTKSRNDVIRHRITIHAVGKDWYWFKTSLSDIKVEEINELIDLYYNE